MFDHLGLLEVSSNQLCIKLVGPMGAKLPCHGGPKGTVASHHGPHQLMDMLGGHPSVHMLPHSLTLSKLCKIIKI